MQHALAIVVGIGLVDSANPATIVPALYLAAGPGAVKSLAGFLAGVFVTNLALGVLIALGPGEAVRRHIPHAGAHTRHLLELTAGGLLLIVAAVLWWQRGRLSRHIASGTKHLDRNSLLLGAGIAVVELPTALPYFAAIAVVVGSGQSAANQVLLLAVFNACFLLPVAAMLGLRMLAGERSAAWLARVRAHVDRWLATLAPGLVALAGLALIAVGTIGLLREP
jgi:cytochrome c biogenesis protein CcdA